MKVPLAMCRSGAELSRKKHLLAGPSAPKSLVSSLEEETASVSRVLADGDGLTVRLFCVAVVLEFSASMKQKT